MIRGMLILLGFLTAGEGVVGLFGLPLPGSVVGMGLLLVALLRGWIALSAVEAVAGVLLAELGVFFVPPAVGVLQCGDLILREWPPILTALVGSSILVLLVTGAIQQALERPEEERARDVSDLPVLDGGAAVRCPAHAGRL
jgi:holin-like protein